MELDVTVYAQLLEVLADAIEGRNRQTDTHLHRVRIFATEIGKVLGLDNATLDALRFAALLHDIGKLAVPEYIVTKPGKLTREEFEKYKIHPLVAASLLEEVQFPYEVAPIVRSHHERWDGTGYPDGLQGHDIPIGARILAVVDTFDALVSARSYRKALGQQ